MLNVILRINFFQNQIENQNETLIDLKRINTIMQIFLKFLHDQLHELQKSLSIQQKYKASIVFIPRHV